MTQAFITMTVSGLLITIFCEIGFNPEYYITERVADAFGYVMSIAGGVGLFLNSLLEKSK